MLRIYYTMKILMVFLIGLVLSMDSFSLAISLGTLKISHQKAFLYSLIVGIMHFIFPILGYLLSFWLNKFISINFDLLLLIILGIIGIELLNSLFSKEEESFDFSILGMLLCALSVSFDSFTIGLSFNTKIQSIILNSWIFFCLSSFFTYFGYLIGHLCQEKIGKLANIMGIMIIIILFILHLTK